MLSYDELLQKYKLLEQENKILKEQIASSAAEKMSLPEGGTVPQLKKAVISRYAAMNGKTACAIKESINARTAPTASCFH